MPDPIFMEQVGPALLIIGPFVLVFLVLVFEAVFGKKNKK